MRENVHFPAEPVEVLGIVNDFGNAFFGRASFDHAVDRVDRTTENERNKCSFSEEKRREVWWDVLFHSFQEIVIFVESLLLERHRWSFEIRSRNAQKILFDLNVAGGQGRPSDVLRRTGVETRVLLNRSVDRQLPDVGFDVSNTRAIGIGQQTPIFVESNFRIGNAVDFAFQTKSVVRATTSVLQRFEEHRRIGEVQIDSVTSDAMFVLGDDFIGAFVRGQR